MKRTLALLILLAGTSAAHAQVRPQPGTGDPRLQTIDYNDGQIVRLEGAPGYQLTLELSPDEQVQNVAVGDSGAWQVNVNRRGDLLFLKPIQPDVSTNMTVITSVRTYNFELAPLAFPSPDMAYTVKFRYPAPAAEPGQNPGDGQSPPAGLHSRYKLSGDKALRPSSVVDDGRSTYVSWPADRPLPAVYSIGDAGQEILVDGMMRDDVMVIDGVVRKLTFKIDNRIARAERIAKVKAR